MTTHRIVVNIHEINVNFPKDFYIFSKEQNGENYLHFCFDLNEKGEMILHDSMNHCSELKSDIHLFDKILMSARFFTTKSSHPQYLSFINYLCDHWDIIIPIFHKNFPCILDQN